MSDDQRRDKGSNQDGGARDEDTEGQRLPIPGARDEDTEGQRLPIPGARDEDTEGQGYRK